MPARKSRPARKMAPLVINDTTTDIGFADDSGFPFVQSSSMMDIQQLQSLDMLSNTSESEMQRSLREEFGSKSGSEDGNFGEDEQVVNNKGVKRKRYHRHTQHQIQELEAYFKECPHPDDKQRKELSRELGLEPLQIKFWFQNKRTQMKNQHERNENSLLRAENEKLRAENVRYREAIGNSSCLNCGTGQPNIGEMSYDEHQLRLENTRLKEEIERISNIAAKFVGKPVLNHNAYAPSINRSLDLDMPAFSTHQSVDGNVYGDHCEDVISSIIGPSEGEKPFIIEFAVAAMEEFVQMAQMGEPLWFPCIESGTTLLNEEEYFRIFPRGIGPKPDGFKTEASRETAVVIMNSVNLVEILMDVNHWSSMFAGVVSRASTIDVLSTGVAGNFNGALQVILAEVQVPSPQVPTRESYFARYCKRRNDGTWAVVDVSLDHLRANPIDRCRRRPSGCLIQEMPNGYSKVTWVEHVEVDDSAVHNIYKPLVSCGLAFGAKRWIATLDRQCERLASAMATNFSTNDLSNMVLTSQDSRKSMLKLAERMVISFCSGVSATTANQWTTLSGSGNDDVRVMTRKSVDDPGRPPGIVLSAATSFWLPYSPKSVFDFLRDENTRNQWDILSNGGIIQEMAHIANGRETGNSVSLLRVDSASSNQSNMLILQESITDQTGSFVIYAPVDVAAMNIVLSGGDPDFVALLPSGFAILPDGPPGNGRAGSGGSLLTVAFQILVDSVPTAKLSLGSIATVNNLIACTVERIKAALLSETP